MSKGYTPPYPREKDIHEADTRKVQSIQISVYITWIAIRSNDCLVKTTGKEVASEEERRNEDK